MNATLVREKCWRCGEDTGEEVTPSEQENEAGYCGPCRAALILPCPCGGIFDRSRTDHRGMGLTHCDTCGIICSYWDDSDLVEPPDPIPAPRSTPYLEDLPEGIGRNGLVWLIHRCVDQGAGHYYRFHVEVEVIDDGVSDGIHLWRVPSIDDPAYVRLEDLP